MTRTRPQLLVLVALTASLAIGLTVCDGAAAKKKGGGGKAAIVSGTTGAIPNGPTAYSAFGAPATNPVPFKGTAVVGKKFKKKTVGDVDATISLSGTPTAGTACGAMCDIVVRLTAPNGATTTLIQGFGGAIGGGSNSVTGNLISNLTLSDQTSTRVCGGPNPVAPPPPCTDPNATLRAPYTGTAQPFFGFLNLLNGSPVSGTWTLTAYDICGAPTVSCIAAKDQGTATILSWTVKITPAKAPK
jgi:hypothetical protein